MKYQVINSYGDIIDTFDSLDLAEDQMNEWNDLHGFSQGYRIRQIMPDPVDMLFHVLDAKGLKVWTERTKQEAEKKAKEFAGDDLLNGTYYGQYWILAEPA
jgi:hypothetical protein